MTQVAIESVFADIKTAAVIVAHPDDETLWAGGTILLNPQIGWTILSLCRKSDPDRSPKFFRVIDQFGAKGFMTDLDDGPDQKPLKQTDIEKTILSALPEKSFDIILTHNPKGEYTRHLRHEDLAALADGEGLQDQLRRLGNGHEITAHLRMGDGHRAAFGNLFLEVGT